MKQQQEHALCHTPLKLTQTEQKLQQSTTWFYTFFPCPLYFAKSQEGSFPYTMLSSNHFFSIEILQTSLKGVYLLFSKADRLINSPLCYFVIYDLFLQYILKSQSHQLNYILGS